MSAAVAGTTPFRPMPSYTKPRGTTQICEADADAGRVVSSGAPTGCSPGRPVAARSGQNLFVGFE